MPEFLRNVGAELDRGERLSSLFGVPEGGALRLVAVLAFDAGNTLAVGRSQPFSGSFPSLTATHSQAHLFEREIWEQHGAVPENHPWLKAVRKDHGAGPPWESSSAWTAERSTRWPSGRYMRASSSRGISVFSARAKKCCISKSRWATSIGASRKPSRAARIAPRFIRWKPWRATRPSPTPRLMQAPWKRWPGPKRRCAPNGSGPSRWNWNGSPITPATLARWPATWPFCRPLRPAARFAAIFSISRRCFAATVLGAAWSGPAAARRMGMPDRLGKLRERLETALAEVQQAAVWLWDAAAVRARFEHTGHLHAKQAAEVGLVGPAARACGLVRDVRFDHPSGWFRFAQVPVSVWPDGDVFARARVRWLEIQRSGEFLREQLDAAPDGETLSPLPALAPDTLAVALVEGWRGEVCHVALTGADGRFRRYKITDPSFHNWIGLGARPARPGHLGLSGVQQEFQPELLRLRPVAPPDTPCSFTTSLLNRLKRGCETMAYPQGAPPALPDRHGGALRVEAAKCQAGCNACVAVCPTEAITRPPKQPVALDLGRCIFCAECVKACPTGAITQTSDHRMAVRRREDLLLGEPGREQLRLAAALDAKAAPAFRALAEVAAGERRRLRRLRGRHERARHHRLGSRPIRHPVRRLAPPCRRPAHYRPRLEEHGAGARRRPTPPCPSQRSSSRWGRAPSLEARLSVTPR